MLSMSLPAFLCCKALMAPRNFFIGRRPSWESETLSLCPCLSLSLLHDLDPFPHSSLCLCRSFHRSVENCCERSFQGIEFEIDFCLAFAHVVKLSLGLEK